MIFETESMLSIDAYHTCLDQISNLNDSYADVLKGLLTHIACYNLHFGHEHFDLINSLPGVLYFFKAKITFRGSHWKSKIRLKVFQRLVSFKCICVASFRLVLYKMNQFLKRVIFYYFYKTTFIDMSSKYQEPEQSVQEVTLVQSFKEKKTQLVKA